MFHEERAVDKVQRLVTEEPLEHTDVYNPRDLMIPPKDLYQENYKYVRIYTTLQALRKS